MCYDDQAVELENGEVLPFASRNLNEEEWVAELNVRSFDGSQQSRRFFFRSGLMGQTHDMR